MIERNEKNIEYIDMTPIVKSDIFVNEDYRGAILTNIGAFLQLKNKQQLKKIAKERITKQKQKVYKP